MRLSREEVRRVWECDRKKERRRLLLFIGIALLCLLITLCFRKDVAYYAKKFTPIENLQSYGLGIKLLFMKIFDPAHYDAGRMDLIRLSVGLDFYGGAFGRLKLSLMTFIGGAGLAIAGGVFQTTYRNPMASPNILGVTAGVNLGNIVMVMIYQTLALQEIYTRYKFCYAFTAGCVVITLLLGKAAGNKREGTTIMEMVMAGAIVSQLINAFVQYFMYNAEDEVLEIYQQISLGAVLNVDAVSFILFISVMAVSIIPMLIFRYRINALGMDRDEAKLLGINTSPWRIIAQVCGVLMSTAAMIHLGQVGMITMVVPYIMRNIVGSDFRKLCIYSALIGGSVVMICQFIASFFLINDTVLPATFVINIITTPASMVIMARQRRRTDAA